MGTEYDDADFVDPELQAVQRPPVASGHPMASSISLQRPPTREELDTKVSEAQQKLADLRRLQEELEHERAVIEEARRRLVEFQTGREEMRHHLMRGIGILEEADFAARREVEQMDKSLQGLREALEKVQAIQEETWNRDNYQMELTRALTTIENARMEWNAALVKWPRLSGNPESLPESAPRGTHGWRAAWTGMGFWELCRLGLALTWPLAVVSLLGVIILGLLLGLRR
jgi:hypothetical protein